MPSTRLRWVGRVLCFLGLHRWEHKDAREINFGNREVVTYSRCRRSCPRYWQWGSVNADPDLTADHRP